MMIVAAMDLLQVGTPVRGCPLCAAQSWEVLRGSTCSLTLEVWGRWLGAGCACLSAALL